MLGDHLMPVALCCVGVSARDKARRADHPRRERHPTHPRGRLRARGVRQAHRPRLNVCRRPRESPGAEDIELGGLGERAGARGGLVREVPTLQGVDGARRLGVRQEV